ncbi:protein Tube [Copidosoma floridanum]|uniref:protein Tube n=1 Tax=Copidosoma floridanum TaxID=29053 RepID=UPI0006C9D3AF|nr:protein Tube [Copidosoma floridanum]XP_014211797.1 protein Tube [Copidosoma floridanum]
MYTLDTDIRKLQPADIEVLARLLQQTNSWRKVMAMVRNEDRENSEPLFNADHVRIIEEGSRLVKKSEPELFLEEWSSIGKKRPTCRILLKYLVDAQLFRAADHLAVNILKIDPPERPKFGPAAKIEIDDKILGELLKQHVHVNNTPKSSQPDTWSNNCQGSTIELPGVINQPVANIPDGNNSSLIPDMMKFSETLTDLMKFPSSDSIHSEDFVLQVADSQDIPCVVKHHGQLKNEDNNMTDVNGETLEEINTTSSNEETANEQSVTTEGSDQPSVDESTDNAGSYHYSAVDVPIPVVVLERKNKS